MHATFWGQFKALVRKNVTIKRRSLNQSLQEFLYPIYFSVILAVIKNTTKASTYSEISSFPVYSITNQTYFTYDLSKTVYVAPDDVDTQTFANNSFAILESMLKGSQINMQYFPSDADMLTQYEANKGTADVGIVFKYQGGQLSDYAIRTPSSSTPDTTSYKRDQSQCRQGVGLDNDNSQCAVNSYIHNGFSVIQTAINTAWIRRQVNTSFPAPSVSVQMMPKPTFTPDTSYLQTISAIYFVMAYSPFVNFLTMNLVAEKEKKIKENMKMMGLQDSAFWLSWSFVYFVIILIVTVIITLISLVSQFFVNSNFFIFFLILFMYGLSILTLSCVLSTFFNKAQVAGGLSGLATMIISCLYLVVSLTKTVLPSGVVVYSVSPAVRWLMCLISPIAVAMAIDQAIFLDQPLTGGMNFTSISYGEFPLWAPMLMLVIDFVLYFFLAVYLDNVIPGEYGPKHKPWYFLQKSYWFAKSEEKMKLLRDRTYSAEWGENVEPVSSEMQLKSAIKVSNLRKDFKTKEKTVHAVNHLSLDMYEGQITCLLGHNGAGKTTLINILTGLLPASGGSATVMGYDVTNTVEMAEIRKMTGVCSQTNVIFEELTAWEHLVLYGGIKGVPDSDIDKQCEKSLKTVDLYKEKDTRSKALSGGQKRKLCVAMALIGDPKVIFLDEPTAGMDPYSRRHLWSILKQKKKDKVILLTTHFMDEADILADRKAIVSKGKLRCCGSSLYLKSKFGIGYHLNMVVNPDCDTDRMTRVVKESVSGAELQRIHGKELAYTLPLNQVRNFSGLFTVFEDEDKSRSLGIKTFGVAMTTLEEVFLKLEEDNEDMELEEIIGSANPPKRSGSYGAFNVANANESLNNVELSFDPTENLTLVTDESELASMQFWSLAKIRVLRLVRIKPVLVLNLILPVIFVVVGLMVSKYVSPPTGDTTPVPMQMSVAAREYAQAVGGSSSSNPFLIKDAVGSSDSTLFMDFLKTQFQTETYQSANSSLLSSDHKLGIDLTSYTNAGNTYLSAFTALYNDSSIHSIPAIINVFSNTLLMAAANLTATNFTSLNTFALPWPADLKVGAYDQSAFSASILISMAFITIPPGFGVDLVKDRQFRIRGQLRVSGVTSLMYWTTNIVVDVIKFLIPAVLMFIVILAFQVESLKSGGALFSLLLLFISVIPSSTLFAYVFSFAFTKFETYQAIILIFYMFTSFIPYMAVSMIDMFGFYSTASIIHYIALVLINPYHVFGGVYFITRVYSRQLLMGKSSEDIPFSEYFSAPIVMSFVMPLLHALFWFFLLRVLDIKVTGGDIREALPWRSKKATVIPLENNDVIEEEDDDVSKERERVSNLLSSDQSIAGYIENLRKEFKKTEKQRSCKKVPAKEKLKIAVRNATFAVDTGEIFGLLGPNGAGKTTTLNMMIAEVGPTKGKVVVGGYDVRSCMSDAFKALGYCPQHDALWDVITLEEHIECYGKIRGIRKEDIKLVTDFYMENIKITEHAKKHSKKLSGGTKRKLSYIMSIISGPKILLLDEPSTGMDPKSKRFLWDTISSNVNGTERGAVLTTHYMEEADALCSRLAIMVNGKVECIGATQHLKGKFGSGYLLEVKLSITGNETDEEIEQKMDSLEGHLDTLFPGTTALERFGERAQYKVKKGSIKSLSHTFIALERAKTEYEMEEYNFSQSTLEQVFLEFAKEQMDEEERKEREEAVKRNPARQSSRMSNSIRL